MTAGNGSSKASLSCMEHPTSPFLFFRFSLLFFFFLEQRGVPVPPVAAPEFEKWGEYEIGNATFYMGAKRAIFSE